MWPTPSAQEPGIKTERLVDKNGNPLAHPNQRLYDKETGRLCQKGLTQAVEIRETWPTPTTQEIEHPDAELTETGRRLSRDGKSDHSLNLADTVQHNQTANWPTPATSNAKGASKKRYAGSPDYRGNLDEAVRTNEHSGQLNPVWVEWLMGFPSGWTDSDASETQ